MKPILQSAVWAVALWLAFAGSAGAQASGTAVAEYRVKAAFLQHFAQFIEWPASALPPSSPIVIGLVGDDPFGQAIDDSIAKKRANGHALVIHHLRWNEPVGGCQMIFISSSEQQHLGAILDAARGSSVLTVADVDRFIQRGGMIELLTEQNRVRFDINASAASVAHLKISSKLLQIARAIRDTAEER